MAAVPQANTSLHSPADDLRQQFVELHVALVHGEAKMPGQGDERVPGDAGQDGAVERGRVQFAADDGE